MLQIIPKICQEILSSYAKCDKKKLGDKHNLQLLDSRCCGVPTCQVPCQLLHQL